MQYEHWNSLTLVQIFILTFMIKTIYVFFTHLFFKIWIKYQHNQEACTMGEKEYIEDDDDRARYYSIPSAVNCFEGMGAVYIAISQWIKKRKARKQELTKNVQEIALTEKKVETINA